MQTPFASGVALALVAVLIWGAQLPVAKSAFAAVDAFHVTAIRYGVATVLLVAFVLWRGPTHWRKTRNRYYAPSSRRRNSWKWTMPSSCGEW